MDPYAALGIRRSADAAAVRTAYRDAVRRWHPDRDPSPEARAKFLAAQQAFEILSDPLRKADNDAARKVAGAAEVVFERTVTVRKTVARWIKGGQAVWADIQSRRNSTGRDLQ